MSNLISILSSLLILVVLFSCENEPIPVEEPVHPPDTTYECNMVILGFNQDTLFRESFDVLNGLPGLPFLNFSTEEGSTDNRLKPFMYRQNDDDNHFSVGEWTIEWHLKHFLLEEMEMFVQPYLQLDYEARHVYNYINQHIDNINLDPHHVDLNFRYRDTLGVDYSNNFELGIQINDADERLNVEILTLDTLEIHGLSNNQYPTEVTIEAVFDGYLFTRDYQDSIYIEGYHTMPISGGGNWRWYPE